MMIGNRSSKFVLFVCIIGVVFSCRGNNSESDSDGDIGVVIPNDPQIEVTSPTTDDIWHPDSTYIIKWNTLIEIEKVDIELYKKDEFRMTIISNLNNEKAYSWTIPADITLSNHYKVKLINSNKPTEYGFSNVFFILSR